MSWQSLNKAPPSNFDGPAHREQDSDSDPGLPPPPYSDASGHLYADPRSSSQQSLVPSDPDHAGKRTLLIIYIHGFNGNSQSFRSFPAHVHGYLKEALRDTHVVHTKLYPRYKTYKAIEVARDKFSQWLLPHEGPDTDVVLVGHSMGGILAADVILMPNHDPRKQQPFKHRILGHVSLDCPFLGLHPGIVVSGIASLFQPAIKPPEDPTYVQPLGSESTLALDPASPGNETPLSPISTTSTAPSTTGAGNRPDPTFNPPFWNDETYEERPFFQSVFSFIKKHRADGIADSVYKRLTDQLEFGGCLANYPGLHQRYKRMRALEDVDEIAAVHEGHPAGSHQKVRFVNYYTLSSNPPKKKKAKKEDEAKSGDELTVEDKTSTGSSRKSSISIKVTRPEGEAGSLKIDLPVARNGFEGSLPAEVGSEDAKTDKTTARLSQMSMQNIDPEPMSEPEDQPSSTVTAKDTSPSKATEEHDPSTTPPASESATEQTDSPSLTQSTSSIPSLQDLNLPPLPPTPAPPELPDLDTYTDKSARKQAEKESKRLRKAYEQAVKDRAKAVKEREKLIERRKKEIEKAESKVKREEEKGKKKEESHEKKEMRRLEKEKARMEKEAEKLKKTTSSSSPSSPPISQPDPDSPSPEDIEQIAKEAHPRKEGEGGNIQQIAKEAKTLQPPIKRKKFCTTPNTEDETWVPVNMEGMNEITAHCGLFFAGPHYERLVGDVGGRIKDWVGEEMTVRMVLGGDVD